MSVFTGTFTTHDTTLGAKGQREDLQDAIFDISPTETPFLSALKRSKVKATTHEWQTDALAAAATDNQQVEGDDITSITASSPTAKVGNYCQISRKLVAVSGTLETVDKAGRKSELAYQLAKRGKELKRDMETMLLYPNTPYAGAADTARVMAGLPLWINTNESRGTNGDGSNHTSGVPTDTSFSDGTQRAFTETIFKAVLEDCWTNGSEAGVLMVGPHNKQVVSTSFTGIVTRNFDMSNTSPSPTAAIAAIDVYVSDWGVVKIIPNRFQRDRDAYILDFDYLGLGVLRPMQTIPLAKTGDAEKRMLLMEYTLIVKNEAALGICADLSTS